MDILFDALQEEVFRLLGKKKTMVLATSLHNRVTARNMSCIMIHNKIYFQTDTTFTKYEQLSKNPNIALCCDNIQIEGVASIKGHPLAEGNEEFATLFEENNKSSFDSFSKLKNEVVIEVTPSFVTLWRYGNTQPFREFLDVANRRAYQEQYSMLCGTQ